MSSSNAFERIQSSTLGSQPKLSIGTLTADVMDQNAALRILEEQAVEMVHIDVMDGRVWPKITVGHFFVGGLQTGLLKDVHLLIEEPEKQIPAFVAAGADMISFSVESCQDISGAISVLRKAANEAGRPEEVKCGLSLYPHTSLELIRSYLEQIDYVTLVAIGPDSGKSNFLNDMPARIAELRSWQEDLVICIDGAVKKTNIGEVAAMGANVIVTGSAVFDGVMPRRILSK